MASNESQEKNVVEGPLTLHEMFRVIGDQLTLNDIKILSVIYSGLYGENDFMANATDGCSFLLSLEKLGRVDETNIKHILHLLRTLTRQDLVQHLTLRRKKTVAPDPVDEYLESTTSQVRVLRRRASGESCMNVNKCHHRSVEQTRKRARKSITRKASTESDLSSSFSEASSTSEPSHEDGQDEIKKKVTCDIRLRVRAEYCQHDNALEGNVFSNKPELIERQFEKFAQANTILKSRDLGSIICDIKFSELTYLDAFWRDYINGSLLEALKGVFITESLKQAVGHESIKLLVNVDEDDYEAGRLKLLQNLKD